jgi:hypothetical protein
MTPLLEMTTSESAAVCTTSPGNSAEALLVVIPLMDTAPLARNIAEVVSAAAPKEANASINSKDKTSLSKRVLNEFSVIQTLKSGAWRRSASEISQEFATAKHLGNFRIGLKPGRFAEAGDNLQNQNKSPKSALAPALGPTRRAASLHSGLLQ